MLASVTRHQVGTLEKALDIFKELGLIEILDSGAIYMMDIQNFIGKSSTEADRQREYYNRIERDKANKVSCKKSYKKSTPETEIELKTEKEIKIDYQQIADMYNNTCVSFPRLTKLSENRKKAIKARLKIYSVEDFQKLFEMAEGSSFLKGQNNRNWSATFDWLIKDTNMAKVLDGNYTDKEPTELSPEERQRRREEERRREEQEQREWEEAYHRRQEERAKLPYDPNMPFR